MINRHHHSPLTTHSLALVGIKTTKIARGLHPYIELTLIIKSKYQGKIQKRKFSGYNLFLIAPHRSVPPATPRRDCLRWFFPYFEFFHSCEDNASFGTNRSWWRCRRRGLHIPNRKVRSPDEVFGLEDYSTIQKVMKQKIRLPTDAFAEILQGGFSHIPSKILLLT